MFFPISWLQDDQTCLGTGIPFLSKCFKIQKLCSDPEKINNLNYKIIREMKSPFISYSRAQKNRHPGIY